MMLSLLGRTKLGGRTRRTAMSADTRCAAIHEKDTELDFWLLASMIVGGMFGVGY
jgi:hypothetical protein